MMTPAEEITARMRGRWYGGAGGYGMIRCPIHGPDRHPSARVRNGETGVPLVSCYLGCDRADLIAELRSRGAWPEKPEGRGRYTRPAQRGFVMRPRMKQLERSPSREEAARINYARTIWRETVKAPGSPVERYWREARGLTIPIPHVIRYGASVPYGYPKPGKEPPRCYPAMVALIQAPDGSGAGIHVTFLSNDGSHKRSELPNSRVIYGAVSGCAIRLCDATDEISIGEGIESSASYFQQFGTPAWAALNTSGVRNLILPPLPTAFKVTLIGENDANDASRKAVETASARLRLEGRLVESAFPTEEWKDFNDPLRKTK